MALHIRSEVVNRLAERLAVRQQVTKTEAVRMALENELRRLDEAVPLRARLRPLQDRVSRRPASRPTRLSLTSSAEIPNGSGVGGCRPGAMFCGWASLPGSLRWRPFCPKPRRSGQKGDAECPAS
jgi:antitoxin VapB